MEDQFAACRNAFPAGLILLVCLSHPALASVNAGSALSDAARENLVRRSYQYVAMYNVNNKFALKQGGGTPAPPTRS